MNMVLSTLSFILFFGFWWIVLYISMHKDRSRYRNIIFLVLAVLNSFGLILSPFPGVRQIIIIAIMILLLIVPFMLIINGILMLKREGRSLANILSLLLGLVILAGELSLIAVLILPYFNTAGNMGFFWTKMPLILMLFTVTVIYGSLVFVAFMMYTLFLQIIPAKKDFDYVIILGSGLIDGEKVSKLLADRLDKAIAVYNRDRTKPIMIPSGGKGSDETMAEGEAMAEYLEEHGIPKEHIIVENQSVNTLENMTFSKRIIDSREGEKTTALVTSNYHVYRALRYCRKIGLKCTGIGARVASYYWPSALIREFVAVQREKKHMILFITGWIILLIPFLLVAFVD